INLAYFFFHKASSPIPRPSLHPVRLKAAIATIGGGKLVFAGARNDNRSVKLPYIYRRRSLLYYRYNFREKEA
ncbi:hypothetical protein, partial [Escherichia coli]|uniref:hypothetical protein n=1 Tax=Escherichia coli TaxID=562 RepID=UPI001F4B5337